MDTEAESTDEPLELTEEALDEDAAEFEEVQQGEDGETVISFSDEPEEGQEETPLVKRLRDQLRQAQRQNRQRTMAAEDNDPEPVVPELKRSDDEEFGWDPDKHADYVTKRDAAVVAHAQWQARQTERANARKRIDEEQAKQVDQQKRALGVSDYEERANAVRDRLNEQQLAVLINATDNPARLLYALGRSEARLDELAGIENLAKFAARIGQLEGQIKVTKRKAPAVEQQVRGATASTAISNSDKHLEKLEKEADRTGDRSKVIAYRRQLKQRDAA